MRKTVVSAAVLIGLGVAAVFLLVFPLITPPRFITTNLSDETFVLTVAWRNQSMNLGRIPPHQQLEFRLNYEPPFTFTAEFPHGLRLASKPVYFARGAVVHIAVSEAGFQVAD